MNTLVTKKPGGGAVMKQSALLAGMPLENADMSAGVAASFPMLGIKGGKWHYRWKGNDDIISDERGFAVPAINVVILKSQKELSRTFYPPGSYVEGANNRPVCWSSDGVRPDDTVPEPVNPVCATCPKSEWGSGATAAAPKAQACQQRRRVVVVPYGDDLTNSEQGGPVLLSLPPSSLRNQDEYASKLTEVGLQYFGCVTQLSFDQNPALAFPRVVFAWSQELTDEEIPVVLELRNDAQVGRILNSKINVDGPEAEGGAAPPAAGGSSKSNSPSESGVAPKPQGSSVKAAPQPVAPSTQRVTLGAPMAAPAAPVTPAAKPKIGGFAIKPTITEAVANPSPPPPSTRAVKAAMPEPAVEDVVREDRGVPDELNKAFGDLMGS